MKNNVLNYLKFFAFGMIISSSIFCVFMLVFPGSLSTIDFLLEISSNLAFAGIFQGLCQTCKCKSTENEVMKYLQSSNISCFETENSIIGRFSGFKAFFYDDIIYDKDSSTLSLPKYFTIKWRIKES